MSLIKIFQVHDTLESIHSFSKVSLYILFMLFLVVMMFAKHPIIFPNDKFKKKHSCNIENRECNLMINKIKLIIYLDYWWPQKKQIKISMTLVIIIDLHSQIIMIIKNTKRSHEDKYRLCQLWNLLMNY